MNILFTLHFVFHVLYVFLFVFLFPLIFCVIFYIKWGVFCLWTSGRWLSVTERVVWMPASTWTMTGTLWPRAWRYWRAAPSLRPWNSSAAPRLISGWWQVTGSASRRCTPTASFWPNVTSPSGRWSLSGCDLMIFWGMVAIRVLLNHTLQCHPCDMVGFINYYRELD